MVSIVLWRPFNACGCDNEPAYDAAFEWSSHRRPSATCAYRKHAAFVGGFTAHKYCLLNSPYPFSFSVVRPFFVVVVAVVDFFNFGKHRSQESFNGAKSWVKELQRRGDPNVIIALAGNKADLEHRR